MQAWCTAKAETNTTIQRMLVFPKTSKIMSPFNLEGRCPVCFYKWRAKYNSISLDSDYQTPIGPKFHISSWHTFRTSLWQGSSRCMRAVHSACPPQVCGLQVGDACCLSLSGQDGRVVQTLSVQGCRLTSGMWTRPSQQCFSSSNQPPSDREDGCWSADQLGLTSCECLCWEGGLDVVGWGFSRLLLLVLDTEEMCSDRVCLCFCCPLSR